MPVIKSAAKRMRQEATRRARNRVYKDELRTFTKQLDEAVESKDSKKTTESLRKLQSHIDKMVKKNLLHANTAARKKANAVRLAKTSGTKPAAKKKATAKKAPAKGATKKAPAKKKPAAKKTTTAKSPAKKKTTAKKSSK